MDQKRRYTVAESLKIQISGLNGPERQTLNKHNERVTQIESDLTAALADSERIADDCRAKKLSDIRKRRSESTEQIFELLKARIILAEERVPLLESFELSLQKSLDEAQKAYDKACRDVIKGLQKVGISAETHPSHRTNSEAAERVVRHRANESVIVRDATAALNEAQNDMARLNTLRLHGDNLITVTTEDLQTFVRQVL